MTTTTDVTAEAPEPPLGDHHLDFTAETHAASATNLTTVPIPVGGADTATGPGHGPAGPGMPVQSGSAARVSGRVRGLRPRVAVIAAVSVLVLALGSLAGYLWVVADHANSRSDWYQQALASTKTDLSASSTSLADTKKRLADSQSQLTSTQAQMRDLANQKAQSDDLVADTKKAGALFTAANDATTKCADKLVQIDNLPASVTRSTFDGLVKELNTACTAANDANNALRTYLHENLPNG